VSTAIQFQDVSKQYRLGEVGTGTLADDLHRAWAKLLGKPDPFAKVGVENNREEIGGEYIWALKDISFEVEQGEVLAIIGRNGAGKSTLLKLLSRIMAPTTGTIKARGRIASLLEVGTGFHPELSGRENIYLNGAILGMTRGEVTKQLDAMIDFSGCAKYIDTPVKRYSSGMTVRLGFAVAAHLECEILIVDEVLAVGDIDFQKKCIEKMQSISSGDGRTVLFVSHNLVSLRNLCQKGLVLQNGHVSFHGTADEAVSTYTKSVTKPALQGELADSVRTGNGTARFSKVRFRDKNRQFVPCVASGDDFTIVAEFKSEENSKLGNVVCCFAFKDDFDNYCWLVRSNFDGEQMNLADGHTIECDVKDFALAPGSYRTVMFLSERDNEVVDFIENAVSLEVKPGAFFSTGSSGLPSHCKVLTRAEWNVC